MNLAPRDRLADYDRQLVGGAPRRLLEPTERRRLGHVLSPPDAFVLEETGLYAMPTRLRDRE